jgi:hypothetical protein
MSSTAEIVARTTRQLSSVKKGKKEKKEKICQAFSY